MELGATPEADPGESLPQLLAVDDRCTVHTGKPYAKMTENHTLPSPFRAFEEKVFGHSCT